MRWLVKSGDIDKMLFFAQASRDRAVYLMAARALQAADWRARPALLRRVAVLYEKAKAPRPLAAFYAACARQEIDEYEVRGVLYYIINIFCSKEDYST